MVDAVGERTREEARDLRDLWSRVARRHLTGGQACSCGFGGVMLQAADFETDIVEYLVDAVRRAGHEPAAALVERAAKRGTGYSLSALLSSIAEVPELPPGTDLLLERLRGTLSSMDEAHGASRFVCD